MSKYTDAVEHNLKGLHAVSIGVCPGCEECREKWQDYSIEHEWDGLNWVFRVPAFDADHREPFFFKTIEAAEWYARRLFEDAWSSGEIYDEPSFSSMGCDICGSTLGGDFESWHAIEGTGAYAGELYHGERACWDCIMYLANGDEPEDWRAGAYEVE